VVIGVISAKRTNLYAVHEMARLSFFLCGSHGQKELFVPLFPSSEETFELFCSVTSCILVDM
jgi:hypothetical protein